MYINHRPAFGLDPYEIYNSFKVLSSMNNRDNSNFLPRHVFLNELQSRGEHMTDYELADSISNLLHLNQEVDDLSKDEMAALIDKYFPDKLSVDKFMSDIIGVPTEDFDQVLDTWEAIRQANTPRINSSKRILTAREENF